MMQSVFIALMGLLAHTCLSADAQVTGTFFPSAAGDVQEGFVPLSYSLRSDVPAAEAQALQLRGELDLARRPYITQLNAYANQSLLPKALQLDTMTPGVEAGFYPSLQTKIQFNYLPSIFGTAGLNRPRVFGQEFRLKVSGQPTDKLRYNVQLGLFQTARAQNVAGGIAVIGATGLSYAINDRIRVGGGIRRDILGNSILSAVGRNESDGDSSSLTGRVKQNTFFGTLDLRPTAKSLLSLNYGGGFVSGHRVLTNPFQQGGLAISRPVVARLPGSRLQLLLPSYSFFALGYKKDQYREAGYFSPQKYFQNQVRLDAAGRLYKSVYYAAGGGLGTINFKSDRFDLGQTQILATANVALITRLSKRVRLEQGWYYLQFGNIYRRNVLYAQSKFYF